MTDNTVVLRNVSKVYRQDAIAVHALSEIDLEVPRKDFMCLSGPSGSGKSTLLNLIGGLDRPSSGEISVDGQRVDQMPKGELAKLRLHKIGFVFQAYNLIPVLTAIENVEFVMQLQGIAATERAEKARAIIDRDQVLDALYGQVFRELLTFMMENAHNVYRATRDLFLAQRFARHVSPLTTTVYTHPSDEEMRGQIRTLTC